MPQGKLRTSEDKVRELQEKLHRSAKRDQARRFHQLYDKVWSPWFLEVAWRKVRANKGAPGPDGMMIESIEAAGAEGFLDGIARRLRERTYKAGPVRRVYIPKANGKLRPLGIPNVSDRVVQAAVLLVLEPIFEADLPETAFGFRPGRNAHQALDIIREHVLRGYTEVVDADLAAYFDTIPHANLLKLVARRVVDRGILGLIKQWLRAPVIEPNESSGSAGRRSDKGTPQGGVISPLLANIYHACIPHLWEKRGHARRLGGKIVSYADDFVILLQRGRGEQALEALRSICERLSLRLNEDKTRVVDAVKENFKFLGFEIQKAQNPKNGKWWPRVAPAKKSEQRVRDRIREIMNRGTTIRAVQEVVGEVNQVLRGWGGYFYYGHPQKTMLRINHYVEQRLRKWLMRKRQRRGPGYTRYPTAWLYNQLGLYRLPTRRPAAHAQASG
jgi:group II intron reverse transcriptase/maturase